MQSMLSDGGMPNFHYFFNTEARWGLLARKNLILPFISGHFGWPKNQVKVTQNIIFRPSIYVTHASFSSSKDAVHLEDISCTIDQKES